MAPAIVHLSSGFLAGLANAAARSLVLGCFVAAALAAFRVESVRARLITWRAVLLAALAMPLLIALSPAISLPVPAPHFHRQNAAAEAALARATVVPLAVHAYGASPDGPVQLALPSIPGAAAHRTVAPPQARMRISWSLVLATGYLVIALILLVRLSIGMRYGKRLEHTAAPIDDPRALQLLSDAAKACGLRSAPRLAGSEVLSVPLMLGVRDPVILFPSGWHRWDTDELAAVLAHEVSHVERRDALTQRLALIHRALFWFSPLSWWLERHLTDLAEQASDEAALTGGADRTRYAAALLDFFAELEAEPERVWWQGVSMAKAGQAEKRIERILAWRGNMSNRISTRLTKSLVLGVAAIAMVIVALAASLHPTMADIQQIAAPAVPAPPLPPAEGAAVSLPTIAPQAPPDIPPSSAGATAPAMPELPPVQVQVPAPVFDIAPVQVQAAAPAPVEVQVTPPAPPVLTYDWDSSGYRVVYGWGPRFAIVTKDSDRPIMSGSEEDADHANALRSKIQGDFIWFEHDEKSYIIRDPATVDRAKKLWEPEPDFAKNREDFAKQQEDLRKLSEELRQKMEDIHVKVPDISADLQKLEADAKKLSDSGATMQQLGELQREIGDLQHRLGEVNWDAARQAGQLGAQEGDLGRKMGEIGRQQGELARQQAEKAREAAREMKQLLDDAIARGVAQPE